MRSYHFVWSMLVCMPLVLQWCVLQLLQRPAELIGTRSALRAAADAVQALDHIVDLLPAHQLTDALQVTVTATQEEYLLDHIVLIGSHIDHLRACALRLILYMFRFHTLIFL